MSSPNGIRQALLFERSYLFLFFASAVVVAETEPATESPRAVASVVAGGWARRRPV
jgi:hypothetical protein